MTTPTPGDNGRDTRITEVQGRSIVVRQLIDLQIMYLNRYANILRKGDAEGAEAMELVGKMLNILETAVVQPDDRDYLENLAIKGKLEIKDLLGFITVFGEPEKPKVRRGRAPVKRS